MPTEFVAGKGFYWQMFQAVNCFAPKFCHSSFPIIDLILNVSHHYCLVQQKKILPLNLEPLNMLLTILTMFFFFSFIPYTNIFLFLQVFMGIAFQDGRRP